MAAEKPLARAPPPEELPWTGQRQRFSVELRPGETTIVSWKRLLREVGKAGAAAPPSADPELKGQVQAGEGEVKDAAAPNRFSAVIEKIERLYMGKHSSDEEDLDDIPDEDEYDTEDSFIDDTELDEYFQVDKTTTKHTGYFVNKGNLERVEPSPSSKLAPKKRRKKDSTRSHNEKDEEHIPKDPVTVSNVRLKAAARNIPLVGKKSSNPDKALASLGEHHQEGKHLKNKQIPTVTNKKESSDVTTTSDKNLSNLKTPYRDASAIPLEAKVSDKHKGGAVPNRDLIYKSKGTGESFDIMSSATQDKAVASQVDSWSRMLSSGEAGIEASTKIRRKDRKSDSSGYNSSGSIYHAQAVQALAAQTNDYAVVRPKGTTLERAIRDLEKIVIAYKPPDLDVQGMDASSQGSKRRLPPEIKQKLGKVARLSASQSKISEDDLIDRLMGILGHLVQRKTLKRLMREMVELGLSAKQQKADRFQQIKREVNEMIRTRVSLSTSKAAEQHNGSADDFQEAPTNNEKGTLKGKFSMDKPLEDKICELYDLYVEGMDEDKGPQSRKLYVQLAELWPNGYMDNLGIKQAISRSKERKRAMINRHKAQDEERIKRKRLASAAQIDETNIGTQVRIGQDRVAVNSSGQARASPDKQLANQSAASSTRPTDTRPMNDFGHHLSSKQSEKIGGRTSMVPEDGISNVKKKLKRKPDSDSGEVYLRLPQQDSKEKHKSHKHSDNANAIDLHKPSLPVPGPPGCDQPS